MNRSHHREHLVLAISILILLVPLIIGGVYIYQKNQWARDRMGELEPRYARLLGMEAGQQDLIQAGSHAASILAQYVYSAEKDASQAGNDAQQKLRDVFSAAGLQIVSSQVLSPKQEKGFDRVVITLSAEGTLLNLQGALVGLSGQKPAIFVDSMSASVVGEAKPDMEPRLTVQFSLSVLRVRP